MSQTNEDAKAKKGQVAPTIAPAINEWGLVKHSRGSEKPLPGLCAATVTKGPMWAPKKDIRGNLLKVTFLIQETEGEENCWRFPFLFLSARAVRSQCPVLPQPSWDYEAWKKGKRPTYSVRLSRKKDPGSLMISLSYLMNRKLPGPDFWLSKS